MESREISLALVLLAAVAISVTGCSSGSSTPSSSATAPTSSPTSPTPTPDPTPSASAADGITITSPANGASVTSPFKLSASASTCSSQTVSSIGYALDGGKATMSSGTSLSVQVSAAAGSHTITISASGKNGAACAPASVSVKVTAPAADPITSLIPSNAIGVSFIEGLSNWQETHDPATPGTSSGSTALVSSPALSGKAREFNNSFSGSGGEIYHVNFGSDKASTDFFYDAWVYLTSTSKTIANLEMDMNQVVANGDTIIYGFQCDGYSGTWDYTENTGSPSSPHDTWIHSSAKCNVRNWAVNTWHHVQISYSRTAAGNVTYNSVWLDGVEAKIDATVPSAFALGWASSLITNFQIDGLGSGSNTVYLNKLTISRW